MFKKDISFFLKTTTDFKNIEKTQTVNIDMRYRNKIYHIIDTCKVV